MKYILAREYPCAPERRRWFVGRVTRLASDGPTRAVVAHEDVTERKLMELKLGRSQARLRAVMDHVQATITTAGGGPALAAHSFDISLAGVGLTSPRALAVG